MITEEAAHAWAFRRVKLEQAVTRMVSRHSLSTFKEGLEAATYRDPAKVERYRRDAGRQMMAYYRLLDALMAHCREVPR